MAQLQIRKIQSRNEADIENIEEKNRQEVNELKFQIDRAKKDNENLRKTLDSVGPEIKGTAGRDTTLLMISIKHSPRMTLSQKKLVWKCQT